MLRKFALLVVLTSLISPPAAAQEIRGRVLKADDPLSGRGEHPLSGAEVELLALPSSYEEARALLGGGNAGAASRVLAVGRSGPEGFYTLQAPRTGLWRLRVSASGYVPKERLLAVPESQQVEPVILHTEAGLDLEVRGTDGEPAPSWVTIEASWSNRHSERVDSWEQWHAFRPGLWTGPSGRVRISRSNNEELRVRVISPGYETRVLPLPLDSGEFPVSLQAEPLQRLQITVVDRLRRPEADGGQPVEDALLMVGFIAPSRTSPHLRALPVGRTDSEGRAEILLARSKNEILTVVAPDGSTHFRPLNVEKDFGIDASDEETEEPLVVPPWELEPRHLLSGRAVDSRSGEPVPGALVWFEREPAAWVVTNREGIYRAPEPVFNNIVLRAEAAGYRGVAIRGNIDHGSQAGESDGRRQAEGTRSVGDEIVEEGPSISLEPVATLTGRITDTSGKPLFEAEIRAMPSPDVPSPPPSPTDAVDSDPDGNFRLPGLALGVPYVVTVRAKGSAPKELEVPPFQPGPRGGETRTLDIVLEQEVAPAVKPRPPSMN